MESSLGLRVFRRGPPGSQSWGDCGTSGAPSALLSGLDAPGLPAINGRERDGVLGAVASPLWMVPWRAADRTLAREPA